MTVQAEVDRRFAFGKNWSRFLRVVNDVRIRRAEESLQAMLGLRSLTGMRFLDIGAGSGIFSLAARRLGAEVVSFDFDPLSVRCAEELRRRYAPEDHCWHIQQGSVLDEDFMASLGEFDVVYSWGVLHHTGHMWDAVARACAAVKRGGLLFIAIYNDQGRKSVWWKRIKRTYTRLPRVAQWLYAGAFGVLFEVGAVGTALARRNGGLLRDRWMRYENVRGMSHWHDIVDWVGGYPFEVATPDAVLAFCEGRGFSPRQVRSCVPKLGCNEFVLERRQ
jgi:2-polyprenyl-3-methyl-5-hydroxy-6-metoxy-1,4-benzoquinol methylase